MLRIVRVEEIDSVMANVSLDEATVAAAQQIVDAIRDGGIEALRAHVEKFDRASRGKLFFDRDELREQFETLQPSTQSLVKRAHDRIFRFATAQRACLNDLDFPVPGGTAGHRFVPVRRAGCYVPAGRYPLPSSALMTATAARVAGCDDVVVASPSDDPLIAGAAWVAGADRMLVAGGAHAIAAMAWGVDWLERRDVIVGPGNRFVTAAKKIVSGIVGIDMLAGPSELVVLSDGTGDPAVIAADLLAQAEHDDDARPILVCHDEKFVELVQNQIKEQLPHLSTVVTARNALMRGAAIPTGSIGQSIEVCNRLAPEHLELHCSDAVSIEKQIHAAGCVFIGGNSAEVFGDYGIGPNHTLPTGGSARFASGLSVMNFLRMQTWLKLDSVPQEIVDDTAELAQLEGLVAHRAASMRRKRGSPS